MAVEIPTSFISEVVREVAADAPTFLGIGVDTALGVAMGGGGIAAAFGAYKLLKTILRKDRKGKKSSPDMPFPRRLEDARQLREVREHVERRCPEYDAAVGRIVQDEVDVYNRGGTVEEKTLLKKFMDGVGDRADALMPPSIKEYIS